MAVELFRITDRSGRIIRLTQSQWRHICEHPEMVSAVEGVRETLEHPDKILKGVVDPQVHYYFRHYKLPGKFLLVAVKYLNGNGFIVTAYQTKEYKKKGQLIWPK